MDSGRLLDRNDDQRRQVLTQRNRSYSFDLLRRAEGFLQMYAESQINYPVIRACTWLGGERLWNDKWLGMSWVALQGIDSLCVVVRKVDLWQLGVRLSLEYTKEDHFLYYYWNAMVNEVEGIRERMFGGSCNCKIPFAVVSVVSGTSNKVLKRSSLQALSAEYCAKKTSKFLQDEMKSAATFTSDKTIQTAISALQHLFNEEFKANTIHAFVWKDGDFNGKELQQWRQGFDLEEILASIHEPDNGTDTV